MKKLSIAVFFVLGVQSDQSIRCICVHFEVSSTGSQKQSKAKKKRNIYNKHKYVYKVLKYNYTLIMTNNNDDDNNLVVMKTFLPALILS